MGILCQPVLHTSKLKWKRRKFNDTVTAKEIILLRKYLGAILIAIVCSLASGCSSQQAYGMGQEYQRNRCLHIPDKAEGDRCLSKINTSYDDYKREKDTTK